MNSSTLRRLAADHASLHKSELPPYYLFQSSSPSSLPDDLTQLTILLTGPQGTPYSQGLWKLYLKMPEDYPKSPPKAAFRTRIWHPNVDENSGSVCVDTLKKDWQPTLTLRDVLITISCLLIQPNPDSALNATAGHLLQEDYDSFTRQAKLMTSIHASIPPDLREAVSAANRHGEDSGSSFPENLVQRSSKRGKNVSSSSVVMRKLPQRITSPPTAPIPQCENEASGSEDSGGEESASKENDPMLSPSPVPLQSPRRPTLGKRPLSDLPTPEEPDSGSTKTSYLNLSDQNILNNTILSACTRQEEGPCKIPQLAETSQGSKVNGRGLQDPSVIEQTIEDSGRSTKRICSDEAKENASEGKPSVKLPERPALTVDHAVKPQDPGSSKPSGTSSSGTGSVKGKARVGLRRL